MLEKKQIEARLELADVALGQTYNQVFISGYKQALREVLEIKMPKAMPSGLKSVGILEATL